MDRKERTTTLTREFPGLASCLILFTTYLSGLFAYVEEKVQGIKALPFVGDVAWLAEDADENEVGGGSNNSPTRGARERSYLQHSEDRSRTAEPPDNSTGSRCKENAGRGSTPPLQQAGHSTS